MAEQLALELGLPSGASLDNFVDGPNQEARRAVQACVEGLGESTLYLWGGPGSGKTHLLVSAARAARGAAAYLGMQDLQALGHGALAGMEHYPLLCLDQVERAAAQRQWEEALFHLFNRARERRRVLILAGRRPPAEVGFALADLRSRLSSGLILPLRQMGDPDRVRAVQRRARERGLSLGNAAARFLLNRYPRDLHSLFALLERLDEASLVAQRRITVPFLKSVLGAS